MARNKYEKKVYVRKIVNGKRTWIPIGKIEGVREEGMSPWNRKWKITSKASQETFKAIMDIGDKWDYKYKKTMETITKWIEKNK